jgi:GT2 family glycosyltransferase
MTALSTIFLNQELIKKVNGFDEQFRLLEDQPFIMKVLLNNYDIYFMNEETVKYRIHAGSITGGGSMNFLNDLYRCYKVYREPYLNKNFLDDIFKTYIKLDFYLKLRGFLRHPLYRAFNRAMIIVRILS